MPLASHSSMPISVKPLVPSSVARSMTPIAGDGNCAILELQDLDAGQKVGPVIAIREVLVHDLDLAVRTI